MFDRVGRGLPRRRPADPRRPGGRRRGARRARPPAHLRTGAFTHRAAGRRPGAPPARRVGRRRRPGAPGCGWTTSPPWCAWSRSARSEAREWAERADGGGRRRRRARDPRARADAHRHGRPAAGRARARRSGTARRSRSASQHGLRPQESKVRSNLGAMAYYAGRWTEAAQWYRSSRDVALEAGNAFVAAQTDVNLGELLINQGHLDEAEEVLVERGARAAGLGRGARSSPRARCSWRGCTSAAATCAEAERRAAEVVSRPSRRSGNPTSALEAALVQAEAVLRVGRGRRRRSRSSTARSASRAPRPRSPCPRMCLQRARALLALDRLDEAAEQVDRRARGGPRAGAALRGGAAAAGAAARIDRRRGLPDGGRARAGAGPSGSSRGSGPCG